MGKAERRGWYNGKDHMVEPYKAHIKLVNGERATVDRDGKEQPFFKDEEVVCLSHGYQTCGFGRVRVVRDCYVSERGIWMVRLAPKGSKQHWGTGYWAHNFKRKDENTMSVFQKAKHSICAVRVDKHTSLTTADSNHFHCTTNVFFASNMEEVKTFITNRIGACSSEKWVICDVKMLAEIQPNVQFNSL